MVSNGHGISRFMQLHEKARAWPVAQVDLSRPVWIFGAGNFGRSLACSMQKQGVQVAGFVETSPQISEAQGMPVIDWHALAAVDQQAQLALGIFNRNTPYDQLISIPVQAGFSSPLMPWDTYDQFGETLGWRYWLSSRDQLLENMRRIERVAECLADQTSRETLLRICAFRLGLDMEFASFRSAEDQYFNALTLPPLQKHPITYIDCGAYNGDTYAALVRQQGITCRQAYLLEPDPGNYASLVRHIAGKYPEAVCLPLAAAEKYDILTFGSGQGEGGAIGPVGDIHIAAVALDQMLPEGNIDLVKLDVEGAEAQVLRGAKQLIERCRPVLTLSLYHNPQDLWELPELLFDICSDYEYYIRQHYFNSFDCVLYAVPSRR